MEVQFPSNSACYTRTSTPVTGINKLRSQLNTIFLVSKTTPVVRILHNRLYYRQVNDLSVSQMEAISSMLRLPRTWMNVWSRESGKGPASTHSDLHHACVSSLAYHHHHHNLFAVHRNPLTCWSVLRPPSTQHSPQSTQYIFTDLSPHL